MSGHLLRNTVLGVAGIVVIGGLAVLAGALRHSSVPASVEQPLDAARMAELIPQGRELALAGDCFGCHSLPEGPMATGGVAMATPFGTIHSTNITPDKVHGIGNYTRADFHRAMIDGIGRQGNLYPAMPFVFTHLTRPDDVDALYAYMMSLPPLAVPNRANTGVFVLPVRPFMNFWTLLNFPERPIPSDPSRSDAWNRGAYLVEGLAHCGACHSPRNLMMGVEFDHALQGGHVDGMDIPDITPARLVRRGFDVNSLSAYLSTGVAPQGTSFAGMYTVTHFSTSAMARDDVAAVATYLLTDAEGRIPAPAAIPAPLPEAVAPTPGSAMDRGRLAWASACAGCHGLSGEGIPHVAPAMQGNAIVAMDSPFDLIKVMLNGIPTRTFGGGQRMYAMPPFAHRMDDPTMADLATWIRAQWGAQGTAVTAAEVAAQQSSRE